MDIDMINMSAVDLYSFISRKPQITAVSLAKSLRVKQKTINAILDSIGYGIESENYPFISSWQVDQVIKRLAKSFKKQYSRAKKHYFALTDEERDEFLEIQELFRDCKNRASYKSFIDYDLTAFSEVSEYLTKLTQEAHATGEFKSFDTSLWDTITHSDTNLSDYTALNTDYLFYDDNVTVEQVEEYLHSLLKQASIAELFSITVVEDTRTLAVFSYLGKINIKGGNYVCSHTTPAIRFYVGNHYYIFNDDDDHHSQRNSARELLT